MTDKPSPRANAIETSLYWQRYVFARAQNPAQRERAAAAIARLEAQLKELACSTSAPAKDSAFFTRES